MKRELRRYVNQADRLPRGYGVAWFDFTRNRAVCYPIPLNRIFGLGRRIYWALGRPVRPPERERLLARIDDLERQVRFHEDQNTRDAENLRALGRALAGRNER